MHKETSNLILLGNLQNSVVVAGTSNYVDSQSQKEREENSQSATVFAGVRTLRFHSLEVNNFMPDRHLNINVPKKLLYGYQKFVDIAHSIIGGKKLGL
ncbi:hypothetical protein AOC23_07605 [Polynucleobacter paneuropaeus]|jgi:hypothetical protein|uniref:hypothetical protein n=1 Tax=Polynucleobacter paneuropaeus TaxID=2527775 RepID=UPI001BFE3FF2|nr:hypothetical protein [Polynucleobacter paneuropaeus]MBT8631932.1 hypothetical protein [Polynucleobacter paneuropaeus]